MFGQYDEEKDNNNAINNLANDKHEVVSFEKIVTSLVFFDEGESQLLQIQNILNYCLLKILNEKKEKKYLKICLIIGNLNIRYNFLKK